MSLVQGSITLNGIQLHDIDVDPRIGGGVDANISEIGDLAVTDVGEIYIKQQVAATGWTKILTDGIGRWETDSKPTGTLTTPTVAVNTNTSLINIGAFDYYIKGVKYSYAGATGLNPNFVSQSMFSYFSINAAGAISFTNNFASIDQLNNVVIGVATSTVPLSGPGTAVAVVSTFTWAITDSPAIETQWADDAIGYLFQTGGLTLNAGTALQVQVIAGVYYDPHRNKKDLPAGNPISGFNVYHVAGVWTYNAAAPITLSNSQYDNGTSLTAIPANNYVVYTLLHSPQSGQYHMIYPQTTYSSLQAAENASVNFGPFIDYSTSRMLPIANIICRQGNANIIEHIDIRPRIYRGYLSPQTIGGMVTLQNAYEQSSEPEIVLNSIRSALSIRDNSTPLGSNLVEITNNANTQSYLSVSASQVLIPVKLGVGTSTPSATSVLHVVGSTRIDSVGTKPTQEGQINIGFGGAIYYRGAYSGGSSRILAEPATWLKININGTDYNIPAYNP